MLAGRCYDPTFGARPLKRLIQKQVADVLAAKLIAGEVGDGDMAELDADPKGDGLTLKKKPLTVNV
jgi:ATP-dependent Clp protease ATP-binding subunit ClpA